MTLGYLTLQMDVRDRLVESIRLYIAYPYKIFRAYITYKKKNILYFFMEKTSFWFIIYNYFCIIKLKDKYINIKRYNSPKIGFNINQDFKLREGAKKSCILKTSNVYIFSYLHYIYSIRSRLFPEKVNVY